MNPYEEAALERRDWFCENCGCELSAEEYFETWGLCDKCFDLIYLE